VRIQTDVGWQMQQRRSAKNQSNEDDLDVASSTASASRSSQSTRAGRGRSENQQAIISTRHQSSHRSRAGCWYVIDSYLMASLLNIETYLLVFDK